ncbi:Phr family secreted Rap phosphatase inhibitor [Bacillus cereus]|uniref:Phr family secreted Rap phosphatase inhibitor n=1 Tax=Bacillus cereus TaxID=1396 RepID=A0A9X6W0Z3_BACCE|nr:Phr family secreted Rap phosphatase inhibitor [Bacillus cereus]PDZ81525.1 Phr family secreted Rap phosphatase inhibitor [Bacillus cereus]PEV73169.1 Phr family secreted Rap phosphatase inhibitor [Bacillus cereus]PEX17657.1 Phr family secreted Rap phosphatase inhibitor [Bacillus cereus]PFA71935.1 Phr family secreted Rap phosphatase inhibitor [Bacillus cereus]
MFLWLVVKNSIELFLNGVNLSTDQSKVNTKSVIQYTHGGPWG